MTNNRYPNEQEVWGAAPDDIYAAAGGGMILHFDGVSWKEEVTSAVGFAGSIVTIDSATRIVCAVDSKTHRDVFRKI